MISVLQKAYPRLAALLSSRGNEQPAETDQPQPNSAAEEATGASWSNEPILTDAQRAEQAAQRVLSHFFEVATERLTDIRSLFARVSAAPEGEARKAILVKLYSETRVLSSLCDSPALESVRKVVKALERLLHQISEQPSCLTPSTLRTTASSIVLLETLCKPGLQSDLASKPPARFLSIDDDPVCRLAVSSALKQAFSAPDQAENGATALALVEKQSYDVIFLDVDMPGMNGYEVCSKIHEIKLNLTTPVVFVTIHSDFDSRAKASEASGADLIAKPFLPCELALKALTILIRRRMQPRPTQT